MSAARKPTDEQLRIWLHEAEDAVAVGRESNLTDEQLKALQKLSKTKTKELRRRG